MELINTKTGQSEDIHQDGVGNAFLSGEYGFKKDSAVPLVDSYGKINEYKSSDVWDAVNKAGYSFPTDKALHDYNMQQKYGDRAGTSFALGAADSLSFGGASQLATKTGLLSQEEAKEIPEQNPIPHALGSGAAIIGSLALQPEALLVKEAKATYEAAKMTGDLAKIVEAKDVLDQSKRAFSVLDSINPISMLDKGAKAISNAVAFEPEIASTASKVANKALQMGIEGAITGGAFQAGEIVREQAIGNPMESGQHILSRVGTASLLGGLLGASAGSVTSAISELHPIEKISSAFEKLKDTPVAKIADYVTKDMSIVKAAKALMQPAKTIKGFLDFAGKTADALESISSGPLKSEIQQAWTYKALNNMAELIEKAKEVGISKSRAAVRGLGEMSGGLSGPVASGIATELNDREKMNEKFHDVTNKISLMANNPQLLLDAVDKSTRGLNAVAPQTAQSAQLGMVNAVSYLNSTAPKAQVENLWAEPQEPNNSDIDKYFIRYNTVNDPYYALDLLKHNLVPKEAIESLKAVYPDLYNSMRMEVMTQAASLKSKPNYQKQLAISQFLGQDLNGSTKPANILANQQNFIKVKSGGSQKQDGNIKTTQGGLGKISVSSRYETPLQKSAGREAP